MKNKAILVIFIATTVAFASFMVYRHTKHKEEANQYTKNTFNRMVDMAKKNPKSGLVQMARALNQYHKDNQSYPPNLKSLYPDHIKNKSFIEDIDWVYKPTAKGFLLSKSVTRDGENINTSIDHALSFKTGKEIMLASRSREDSMARMPTATVSPIIEKAPVDISKVIEADRKTPASMVSRIQAQPEKEIPADIIDVEKQTETAEKSISEEEPALIAGGSESRRKLIADAGSRYLVWIGKDGHLGFSNVQYPDKKSIGYYYIDGRWEAVIR